MNFTIEIENGDKEPIVVFIVDSNGDPLTGKTNLKIKIRRISDHLYFDWNDDTFKDGTLVSTLTWPLTEISAIYSPGEYHLSKPGHIDGFDTSTITNANSVDNYYVTAIQDGGVDAANIPMFGEIRVVVDSGSVSVEDRYPVIF